MSKTNYRYPLGNRPEWTAEQTPETDTDEDGFFGVWTEVKAAFTRLPGEWIAEERTEHWLTETTEG